MITDIEGSKNKPAVLHLVICYFMQYNENSEYYYGLDLISQNFFDLKFNQDHFI